jgi:transposase InsO family protein
VISDRGPQFASQVTKELYRLLGIERKLSTAYHPQTDGQTERVNQELEIYLRIFTSNEQDQWANWLHLAEFTHNHRAHSSKGVSPFYIIMGYNPKPFPTIF